MSEFINRPQIEVLSAAVGERRRYWSDDDKLRIVEESSIGHRQVAATARRYGVCRSLLTTWREQPGVSRSTFRRLQRKDVTTFQIT